MGNSLGGKKTTKIMKINGETWKLETPVQAGDVLKDYPGLVLLESETVKHFGTRAKPLELSQQLKPKSLYFLVELPEEKSTRRVRSAIHMSAKDRLESLKLTRRSASDLSIMNPSVGEGESGGVRLKLRLSRAELAKLVAESKDGPETAEKIVGLYKANKAADGGGGEQPKECRSSLSDRHRSKGNNNMRQKRVGFFPIMEGEAPMIAAS